MVLCLGPSWGTECGLELALSSTIKYFKVRYICTKKYSTKDYLMDQCILFFYEKQATKWHYSIWNILLQIVNNIYVILPIKRKFAKFKNFQFSVFCLTHRISIENMVNFGNCKVMTSDVPSFLLSNHPL